jgi:hypothetical protein
VRNCTRRGRAIKWLSFLLVDYCVARPPARPLSLSLRAAPASDESASDARMRISARFGRVHKSNLYECMLESFVCCFVLLQVGCPWERGGRVRVERGASAQNASNRLPREPTPPPFAATATRPPARLTACALIALLFNQTQTRLCRGWSKTHPPLFKQARPDLSNIIIGADEL